LGGSSSVGPPRHICGGWVVNRMTPLDDGM
jgi:hypothetical protein